MSLHSIEKPILFWEDEVESTQETNSIVEFYQTSAISQFFEEAPIVNDSLLRIIAVLPHPIKSGELAKRRVQFSNVLPETIDNPSASTDM